MPACGSIICRGCGGINHWQEACKKRNRIREVVAMTTGQLDPGQEVDMKNDRGSVIVMAGGQEIMVTMCMACSCHSVSIL